MAAKRSKGQHSFLLDNEKKHDQEYQDHTADHATEEYMKAHPELFTDYETVMTEMSEEVLARLSEDPNGTVIDMFRTGSFDPWQLFLFYGIMERVLCEYRKNKRSKKVFIFVQPEGLVGAFEAVTPMRTLMQHIAYRRSDEIQSGRLQFAEIIYTGEQLIYNGADLKNQHCILLCDEAEPQSPYLAECISMCQEMNAAHVMAIPLMMWDPEEMDKLDRALDVVAEQDQMTAVSKPGEKTPVS